MGLCLWSSQLTSSRCLWRHCTAYGDTVILDDWSIIRVCPTLIPLCVVKMPPNLWLLQCYCAKQSIWLNCCPDQHRSSACFNISQHSVHCGLKSLFVCFCHFNPSVIHHRLFPTVKWSKCCASYNMLSIHTHWLLNDFQMAAIFVYTVTQKCCSNVLCYLGHSFISVINYTVESVHLSLSKFGYLCSLWS